MYTISLSAIFPEDFYQEIKTTFLEDRLSWRSVDSVWLTMWQSMAFRRFANHKDSYYIGGNYGEKDTTLFQDANCCVTMTSTIPAEYNEEFKLLFQQFLVGCADDFDLYVNKGEEYV